MGKLFDYMKGVVNNIRLNKCCYCIPVRIGLLIISYFSIMFSVIVIIGLIDDSFQPILVQVQASIFEDEFSKFAPVVQCVLDLAFNVILLCGIHRNDLVLVRLYMKYCIGWVIAAILFYSMMLGLGVFIVVNIVLSILFQTYVLVLVRSLIVEIRLKQKNLELPTLLMSTVVREEKEKAEKEKIEIEKVAKEEVEKKAEVDVEAAKEHEVEVEKKLDTKLATVDECPKEETVHERE